MNESEFFLPIRYTNHQYELSKVMSLNKCTAALGLVDPCGINAIHSKFSRVQAYDIREEYMERCKSKDANQTMQFV